LVITLATSFGAVGADLVRVHLRRLLRSKQQGTPGV
jgi:hypothetical protein